MYENFGATLKDGTFVMLHQDDMEASGFWIKEHKGSYSGYILRDEIGSIPNVGIALWRWNDA
jgi:hypothetical protein